MADRSDNVGSATPKAPPAPPRHRPFRAVATESVANNLAGQLTAAAVVLPFIAVALGGPLLAATLIYPVYTLANLIGVVVTPTLMASGRSSKFVLTASAVGLAAFTAVNAIGSQVLGEGMAIGFVATAAVLGFLSGMGTVSYLDVVAGSLAPPEQSRLPVLQSSLAAGLVLAITGLDRLAFGDVDAPSAHIRLLWLGALALLVAAASCLLIQTSEGPRPPHMRIRDILGRGVQLTRRTPWLRRYLLVQTLFLTVALGSAFYSAHGATTHGSVGGSLHLIVAVSSVGLLVFAVAWVPLRPHIGLRGMYWLAGGLAFLSASLCVVVDALALTSVAWVYGVILAASAISALAVTTAKQVWLLRDDIGPDRLEIISFTQLVVGLAAAVLGAALATLAHVQGAIWPVYVMLGLDLLAMTMIRWAPPLAMTKAAAVKR
jgi:hypothetical protein